MYSYDLTACILFIEVSQRFSDCFTLQSSGKLKFHPDAALLKCPLISSMLIAAVLRANCKCPSVAKCRASGLLLPNFSENIFIFSSKIFFSIKSAIDFIFWPSSPVTAANLYFPAPCSVISNWKCWIWFRIWLYDNFTLFPLDLHQILHTSIYSANI